MFIFAAKRNVFPLNFNRAVNEMYFLNQAGLCDILAVCSCKYIAGKHFLQFADGNAQRVNIPSDGDYIAVVVIGFYESNF